MLGPGNGGDLGARRGGQLDLHPTHAAAGAGHQDTDGGELGPASLLR